MSKDISKVRKRDGRIVDFDETKISDAIWKAFKAVGIKDKTPIPHLTARVVETVKQQLKEGEIPDVEMIQDCVERVLIEEGHARVAKAYILYRQKRAELRKEKAAILEKETIDEIEKRFDVNALKVLKSRYLRKDESGKLVEWPKQLFTRVAVNVALPDIIYDEQVFDINAKQKQHEYEEYNMNEYKDDLKIGKYTLNKYHVEALKSLYDYMNSHGKMKVSWSKLKEMIKQGKFDKYEKTIEEFFDLMTSKRFLPNTPAIANFGASLGLGSACFVLDIDDSLDSIMTTLLKASKIFQAGGGLGYNFSKLRPEGDYVSTTGGKSSGPISFMTLFDKMTDVIKQGGCVSVDTFVRTDKGLLPMLDFLNAPPLKDNPANIFVYDGKEYSYCWLAQNNGIAPVYTVKTGLGIELKATGNHMVATVNENGITWKEVEKLQKGDWIITVLGGHQGIKVKLPPIEKQHKNSNKIKIPEYLDEDLAELLGLYMADGCFSRGRMIFTVNAKDADLAERIIHLMKKLFNLHPGERRERKSYVDLVFFSKDLERYFESLNWKKQGAKNAFVPKEILQSEEKVVFSFIRGLFEGDGTVHSDGYPVLTSTSKRLVDEVQQLLLSVGIVSRKSVKSTSAIKGHKDRNNIYTLLILGDESIKIFKEKINFISQRKVKKFEEKIKEKKIEYFDLIPIYPSMLEKYYTRVGKGCSRGKREANLKYYKDVYHYLKGERKLTRKKLERLLKDYPFLKDDKLIEALSERKYFFDRVEDIGYGHEVYTMEIEVPGSNSYIANGLLVHNMRRGANMGILNINHPDIEKFIKAKEGNKMLRNFNISVLVMPDFWEYYEKNKPYPLVNPRNNKVVKYVNPRLLFDMICYQAWESAEPGVIFFDHVNKYNPFLEHLGPIVTTNPCVAADTMVSTGLGLERIDSIRAETITVDARLKSSRLLQLGTLQARPMQIIKTGVKDTLKLTTKSGYELVATPDHRIMTNKGWKQLCELTEDDYVLIQSGAGQFNESYDLPFKVKNEIVGKNNRKYKFGLPTKWTRELALLLGWLVGDGFINEKHHTIGLVFSPEDEEARKIIQPIFEKYCNRKIKLVRYENGCVQISSKDKHIVEFFLKLGYKGKQVPASIFTAPRDVVLSFLSGLFSSDGTINLGRNSRNYIRLNSSSLQLLKQVQLLLLNLGIKSVIYDRSTKPKVFFYNDKSGKQRVYETSGENYELNVSRKNLERFIEMIDFLQEKNKNKLRQLQQFKFYQEYFMDKVAKIEYAGKREVWDITEPMTNSFIANGIVVHNCGEVLLYPNESCNLGSINVWSFVKRDEDGKVEVDWDGLKETVRSAVRFLDNVIDINKYPLEEIREMTFATRKIGLGIMGLADMLFELELAYNSDEGRKFMEKLMEFINYWSKVESIEIAKRRGKFPYFEKSFYKDGKLPFSGFYDKQSWNFDWDKLAEEIKKHGIRNSYTTVIAPTGSISMIAGCSSGIEPVFTLVYEKHVAIGSFFYVEPVFERAMTDEGLYDEVLLKDIAMNRGSVQGIKYIPPKMKKVFVTALDIGPEDHVRALAAFQKWVDSSISKTINLPATATVDDVKKIFLLAYKLGCKDVTIYRDTSIKDQVYVAPTIEKKQQKIETNNNDYIPSAKQLTKCPECGAQLVHGEGCVTCPSCGWGICK
jgi:ribonucleoside-diphosphate reductase alpha chain